MFNIDKIIKKEFFKTPVFKGEGKAHPSSFSSFDVSKFGLKSKKLNSKLSFSFKSSFKMPQIKFPAASMKKQFEWRTMPKTERIVKSILLRDIDNDGVPDKYDCAPKNPYRQDVIAYPLGAGQTRFRRVTKSGFKLEPTHIPIYTQIYVKSKGLPIHETEVKTQVEKNFPKQDLLKVKEIYLTSRQHPSWGIGGSNVYGQAFKTGRIDLYAKPFKQLKTQPSYYNVGGGSTMLEKQAHDKYLYDVLPHEIGHHKLGHTSTVPNDEAAAEQYAAQWRLQHNVPMQYDTNLMPRFMLQRELEKERNKRLNMGRQQSISDSYVDYSGSGYGDWLAQKETEIIPSTATATEIEPSEIQETLPYDSEPEPLALPEPEAKE